MLNKLTNINDTKFIIYNQLTIEDLCNSEKFQDHSKDTFEMILSAAEKIAVNDFEPVNKLGDEQGCSWQNGVVRVPASFHSPFQKYVLGGWISMPEGYDVGGQNVPLTIDYACREMFFAACHSLSGYMGLTHSAAKVIEIFGNEAQKNKYMSPLYTGEYMGAMVLTESQAGSDVGAVRTKAIRNKDGTFSIQGSKIFITGGEHDLTRNIIHIILARIEDHPEGISGLSCFVVPKIRVNDDGTLGQANDVKCSGIEHKMGMKGSSTCVLNFGDNGQCIGEILGPERKGIIVMFNMMNEQRVLVGLQGLAQGSTAYLHALEYAKERKQGTRFGSKTLEQVPIIEHPDVRRNLLWMRTYTEGMRSLILYIMSCIDRKSICIHSDEAEKMQSIVEVLTPVCKAFCTDKGFDVCSRAMQVFGGYGYCTEYKVEQFMRDCKITSIYEGANGIQSIDLFGRKIRTRNGIALDFLYKEIEKTVSEVLGIIELRPYAKAVGRALAYLKKITSYLLTKSSSKDAYLAYSWASSYLEIFGDVVLGWLFLWQARVAHECLSVKEKDIDEMFCKNKMLTAKFYIDSLLPVIYGKVIAIKRNDKSFLHIEW